jgi:predicted ATPase
MAIDGLALRNFMMFTGSKIDGMTSEEYLEKSAKTSDSDTDADGVAKYTVDPSNESFYERFVGGINVFIGANATGKTTLLKCIYAACEWSNQNSKPGKAEKFQDFFSASKRPVKVINQKENDDDFSLIRVFSGGKEFHFRAWDGFLYLSDWLELGIKSVLIPSAEMLSHSKGLIAMSLKWGLPFDSTQTDILVNAQLPETKEISDRNRQILKIIGDTFDGEIAYEDDTFFVIKNGGMKIEFSLEAEGFKKLGLLWKLIRNGLLESGSILLWDEPETSINPELIPLLVDIMYILKNDGVQIFLATQSYHLAKYLDLRSQTEDDVLFISLHKNDKGMIKTDRTNRFSSLKKSNIEIAEENLFNAVVENSIRGS